MSGPPSSELFFVYAGKVWFLDRMVWLYEDMKEVTPEYSGWLYDNKDAAPIE